MFCNMDLKHAWLPFFIIVGVLLIASPLHLSNRYLRASDFDVVIVQEDENASAIALRYTNDTAQAKRLCEAIIDINALTPDGALRAGQSLRIPVLARSSGKEVASREMDILQGN
ncbi:LysM peptidoglycan-binding domain-containing protein [Mitsuokella sp. oral taxon 131]|uniref:LysM peptidoglycan-binding domain-containing protein n=1 Tax=Mitsuokella sp. oral taxon 131 TaxID=1321780 RepID=UPI0003ADFFF5|nr:LysM peptidoglycan-binding domain-containing protein [Mitsuokella sp. oral taxon 131]ERL03285.1 LysM domain protein [Mitsuokella sp. oral taxon 131 str. W9106]